MLPPNWDDDYDAWRSRFLADEKLRAKEQAKKEAQRKAFQERSRDQWTTALVVVIGFVLWKLAYELFVEGHLLDLLP